MNNSLSLFVKEMRKRFGLTQVDLAAKAGVGLRFVRELDFFLFRAFKTSIF